VRRASNRRLRLATASLWSSGIVAGALVVGSVTGRWRLASTDGGGLALVVPDDGGWRKIAECAVLGDALSALSHPIVLVPLGIAAVALVAFAAFGRARRRHRIFALATAALAGALVVTPASGTFTANNPAADVIYAADSLATPTTPSCATNGSQIDVTWNTASTDSWADGHSLSRSVNGGAYTDDYALTSPRGQALGPREHLRTRRLPLHRGHREQEGP
jgi:hypothetical protein